MTYVIDACAFISYYNKEPGGEVVKNLITDAVTGDSAIMIHRINLFEVYYDLFRSGGEDMTNDAMSDMDDFPIGIIDMVSEELMKEAARFKLKYKVSVADAFALATAKLENATIVTADHHEFDPIEVAGELSFLWIR